MMIRWIDGWAGRLVLTAFSSDRQYSDISTLFSSEHYRQGEQPGLHVWAQVQRHTLLQDLWWTRLRKPPRTSAACGRSAVRGQKGVRPKDEGDLANQSEGPGGRGMERVERDD